MTRKSQTVAPPPSELLPEEKDARVNGKPSGVRYASNEQFQKAHRKTSTQHAGLFRRLAE